ncbi:MAG TPA: ABC transporter permease subunit, partial [Marisediminicola sp.]|nr:ABC transporter permease subunit [Marisediminicola sp.]
MTATDTKRLRRFNTARTLRQSPMWAKHLTLGLGLIALWELSSLFLDPIVLPPFHSVVVAFFVLLFNGSLIAALGQSLLLLVLGLAAALVTGLVVGIIVGRVSIVERMVVPFLGALYAMPTIALIPLMLVWFGFGLGGRVVVVWLVAFFPMLVAVHAGVRDAPRDLTEVARSFGVRREITLLRTVILPSALPMILNGLRLSVGRGIVGMVIAEVYLRLG